MREIMKMKFLRNLTGKIDKTLIIAKDGSYIRNKITEKKLIPYIHQGYRVISITINGKYYKQIKVCHLQWLAWKGIIPKGYHIHHNEKNEDGNYNKLNDHINNLNCLTNSKHMKIHNSGENNNFYGKNKSGKKNPMYGKFGKEAPNVKLKNRSVKEIRCLGYIEGWTIQEIADKFKISWSCIQHIISGSSWNPSKLTKEELIIQTIKESG